MVARCRAGTARNEGAIMNTIGKTLVILNLVFAVVTGGLLAIDFTYRNNWREEAEHRTRVAKVAVANGEAAVAQLKTAVAEKRKLQADLDRLMLEVNSDKANYGAKAAQL